LLPLQSVGGYSRKLRLWRWRVLERKALVLLPLALLGVFIAFRIDGHFVGDYLGTFVFFLYFLLLSALLPISKNQAWRRIGKV